MMLFLLYCVLFLVFLFVGRKIWMRVVKFFKDLFVFWSLLEGQRSSDHQSTAFRSKLYCFMCESDLIDEAAINELYTFGIEYIDSKFNVHDFHKMLLKQSHVAFFRDCSIGSLRGYLFFRFIRKKEFTLFNLGTTLLSQQYRGSGVAYAPTAYVVIKEMIRHPFTPIYLIGRSFGYKSYLAGCKMWPAEDIYPHYKRKTPDYIKDMMEDFARSVMAGDETYDREKGVIKRDVSTLKSFASAITEEDKKDPNIKFYTENNPGWVTGSCMIVVCRLSWLNVLRTLKKTIFTTSKSTVRTSKHGNKIPSPVFGKQFSYIDKSSGRYYVPACKSDLFGGSDHSTKPGSSHLLFKKQSLSSFSVESDPFGSIDLNDLAEST